MIVTHELTLDLTRRLPVAPISTVQGDSNTRLLKLTLLENGANWVVPEGVTASVGYKKPDGTKGWYDTLPDGQAACVIEKNLVAATLAPQMLTVSGNVTAAVVFMDADLNRIATFPFCIQVLADPAAGETVSNDYYDYSTMEDINAQFASLEAELFTTSTRLSQLDDSASIVCDAAGGTITLTDASNRELQGLTLYGKTTQNGTPTPETPVPLESSGAGGRIGVTVTGKNLMRNFRTSDADMVSNGITFTTNRDGTFTANGVNDGNGASTLSLTPGSNWLYLPKGTYTAFSNLTVAEVGYFMLALYDKPSTSSTLYGNFYSYNTPETFTLEKGKFAWMCIRVNKGYTADALVFRPQIELGTTATAYEPYSVQTLTVSTPNGLPGIPVESGGNYTDETGQAWICDEIDFARGVYVQRIGKKIIQNGDSVVMYNGKSWLFRVGHLDGMLEANIGASLDKFLCNYFDAVENIWNSEQIGAIVNNATAVACIPGYTADDVKAWIAQKNAEGNPLTFTYVLETPTETALSDEELTAYAALHTNKPNTTVYNDASAHMQMSYVADTKSYIDQKLAAISAAMLNT